MKKKIKIIILIGFLINILFSFYYIQNYNDYEKIDTDGEFRHNLIKGINENHWLKAYILKKDIKSGKNFLESGDTYNRNYLPSINFYIYALLSGDELYEENEKNLKISQSSKKIFFLIFQSLLYSISLIFLFNSINKSFSNRFAFIFILILALEPTINQWHQSFYSASIFISLQLFLLSFFFKNNLENKHLIFIGLILGLLFAQRSAAVFYYFVVLFYFIFFVHEKKLKKIAVFTISYLSILLFILVHNYNRSGLTYITPLDQRTALYHYLEPIILSSTTKQEEILETKKKIKQSLDEWKEKKNLNLDNEKDLLIYYDEMKKRSLISILNNPIRSFKIITNKIFHSGLLDPVHIYFFHTTEYEGVNPYYGSKLHKSIVNYRLIYSLIIYCLVIYGFVIATKKLEKKTIFFITFSYIYFLLILGWMGSTRYYASCLIFVIFFLSYGIEVFIKKNKCKFFI